MPPLSGVRVIDLTIVVAGPVGTGLLGDLGADVIKVENTVARQIIGVAPLGHTGGAAQLSPSSMRAASYSDLNRSKRGITLNLNLSEARDILMRMVAISDVVIDNFSPRVMRNFGLEYDNLVKVKPDIIAVSMPAFGKTGPFRDRTSFGPGIDALSGLSHVTGYPDHTPLKPGNYFCDYNAGFLAASAIMAALFHRHRTGQGQAIEVAMRDGLTQLLGPMVLDFILNDRVQTRTANADIAMAPHGIYRCRGEDRWLALAVRDDRDWASFAGAIGRPELGHQVEFESMPARKANESMLNGLVATWTATQTAEDAAKLLQAAGIPAAVVATTADIAADPQFIHRQAFQDFELSDGSIGRLQRAAWMAKGAQPSIRRGPDYSEHTVSVLRDLVGANDDELGQLAAIGAVVLPTQEVSA